ncbi:class II aldolase/adducin family protein [Paracoccus sp. R12_1]|jgi:L-fuculose-phosphate aldolase|uniref:class II aldolase/adducin family protein n=1 Tax=unclassified Paracoccus (in: a-proteobacteria) TaxID=2688777 RepID=UPI000C08EBFF|nr:MULTISPECIES: class II aldolase/adducin family protein [unclassified Paracoccus (in: a-proteobacteria)]MBO9455833.1 class II aldolase/adducin family protein [Paracoccus sp. R12_2]MBO9488478.1 class II aldolase/adducin family protein [Paracoccus sp. R12_1]PHQ71105.1 MAG: class II aldolase [Paracoccus sp. (in: a-proteobacteria)]
MTDDERALRSELIESCRNMNRLGINKGTSGNISVRHGDGFLISPTGIPYDKLQPEHVVAMNWDATYEGEVQPSSEWRFHRDILQARPDLNAVVHTHSTHATALSILGRDIPAIHYVIAAAGGSTIRCAPYELFGTQELADRVVSALQGRRACLMAHHGVIAGHATIARALALAVTVEELATQYLLCLPMGEPPILSDDQIAEVLVKFKTYGQQSSAALEGLRQAS